jgi:hypothetical protein
VLQETTRRRTVAEADAPFKVSCTHETTEVPPPIATAVYGVAVAAGRGERGWVSGRSHWARGWEKRRDRRRRGARGGREGSRMGRRKRGGEIGGERGGGAGGGQEWGRTENEAGGWREGGGGEGEGEKRGGGGEERRRGGAGGYMALAIVIEEVCPKDHIWGDSVHGYRTGEGQRVW